MDERRNCRPPGHTRRSSSVAHVAALLLGGVLPRGSSERPDAGGC